MERLVQLLHQGLDWVAAAARKFLQAQVDRVACEPVAVLEPVDALFLDAEHDFAAGDEHRARGHRVAVRATFSRRPAAVMVTSSDEPPNDRNGRVRPVSGITPTTPPTDMQR